MRVLGLWKTIFTKISNICLFDSDTVFLGSKGEKNRNLLVMRYNLSIIKGAFTLGETVFLKRSLTRSAVLIAREAGK